MADGLFVSAREAMVHLNVVRDIGCIQPQLPPQHNNKMLWNEDMSLIRLKRQRTAIVFLLLRFLNSCCQNKSLSIDCAPCLLVINWSDDLKYKINWFFHISMQTEKKKVALNLIEIKIPGIQKLDFIFALGSFCY